MNTQMKATNAPQGAHKHLKHNSPVAESMLYSLLAFLCTGLLLSSGIQQIRKHLLVTTGMTNEVDNFYPNNSYLWKPVHHHSDILVYEAFQNTNSTHPMYHFEFQTDVPLESFLDVLDHPEQSMEWFAWTKNYKFLGVHKKELSNLDILSSKVNAQMVMRPLGYFHEREFITEISADVATEKWEEGGGETTTAKFTYSNVPPEDEIKNAFTKSCKDCIRGAMDMVLTLTTDDYGLKTLVAMDLDMDMKSTNKLMPNFITDSMIMHWGEISLHKLVKRCKDNIGLENVVDFKASIMNLIPIKR